ncbi:MAG: hydrogenase subunit MbhD domain-containing protein [Desulfurococcaceae archaeon]
MIITILILLAFSLLSLVFVYMAITERDLLKATAFSAGQSICYAVILQAMGAADIVMTYVAVSVGLYSALLIFVISKTERFEEVSSR